MFDNRGFNSFCRGVVDEFMVFNSVVAPEVAIEYFSLSKLEKLILGDSKSPNDKRNGVSYAKIKRRMNADLLGAGMPPSDQGLKECLKCFSSKSIAEKRVADLIQELGDRNYATRNSASFRLRIIGNPALTQLEKVQQSSETAEMRFRTASLIKEIKKASVSNASSNADTTMTYISANPNRDYVPYLFSCLAATSNESTRISICTTIQDCVSVEDRSLIREYLVHSDKWIRLAAVCSLAKLPKHDSLKQELKPLLLDKDELIQLSAISTLQKHYPESVKRSLQKLLQSKNWKVRYIAEAICGS